MKKILIFLFCLLAVLLTMVCLPFAESAGERWSVALFVTVVAAVAEVIISVLKREEVDWEPIVAAVAGTVFTILIGMLC